jgi:VacB/RNase II family 3'-5' exoribonuclease
MLNIDSLSQLKALKSQINETHQASILQGIVRGSQGRFGFVATDKGESYFLTPDEMGKVFPGDTIQFTTVEDDKGKTQAVVEKLLSSNFKAFTGRFLRKGKAQFAVPDVNGLSTWLYLPPAACEGIEENDWISCEVTRHPFPSGKPQAKVSKKIGGLEDAGFERQYSIEKFKISHEWPETTPSELALLAEDNIPTMSQGREDLTALPFVTIDSEHTRDMDDALFAEKTDSGFNLYVAIADPSAWFGMNTALDKEAARRSNSLYFPGRSQPMLPQELSNGLCSLLENKDRLALVCKMAISESGENTGFSFSEAIVNSKGKLNYHQVSDFLDDNADVLDKSLTGHVKTLHACTSALNTFRGINNLIMDDRPDYYLTLGDNGKIQTILKADRNTAQKLVEEAMLVANISSARFMADSDLGLFIQHAGFRTERIGDVKTIIEQQNIKFEGDFTEAEGYKALIQALVSCESEVPLKTLFSRFLIRSEFTTAAEPHQGMGFDMYSTFTSPIRKYNDLLVHRIIKSKLSGKKPPVLSEDVIKNLQERLITGRNAVYQAENWLKLQFLTSCTQTAFDGHIVQLNQGGFTVQLTEIGIDGFVDLRKQKFDFDKIYLTHKKGDVNYQLNHAVKVSVKNIDLQNRKLELAII